MYSEPWAKLRTRSTPKMSDSPEAMRKRNIAAVKPPRNWPNRNETSGIAAPEPLSDAALGVGGPPAQVSTYARSPDGKGAMRGGAPKQNPAALSRKGHFAPLQRRSSVHERSGVDI